MKKIMQQWKSTALVTTSLFSIVYPKGDDSKKNKNFTLDFGVPKFSQIASKATQASYWMSAISSSNRLKIAGRTMAWFSNTCAAQKCQTTRKSQM